MTRKSKVTLLLAPLACLLCPAHLLGYLLATLGGARIAAYHGWMDAASVLIAVIAIGLAIRRWEGKRGHHHCDQHHDH